TDMTWVNGQAVGGNYDPGSPRRYPLPAGLLQAGDNRIVVNVLDTWRDGGMGAPASAYRLRFADGSSAALAGWEYRAEAPGASPPGAPWQSAGGLSTLHNGMIAPLGRYGLRGLLWYQGESNTGEAAAYPDLLRRLGAGMRARFGARLPILVVQLAGYGMPPTVPGESGWADVREAQRQVVAGDADMALVVALDIGDRYDIHPPNKQELGRRLARAASRLVYTDARAASGPVAVSATRRGDAVVVGFDGVGDALVAYGADGPIGFELCSEASDSCRYANATIEGRHVLLRAALPVPASPGSASPGRSSPASAGPASAPATHAPRVPHGGAEQPVAPATRVRYGWADNPVVNLFDRDGLPAGPFEITVHDVAHRTDQGGNPDAPSTGEHE
ncbi:MAG TPA: sialate O-acetylesterase, partial [Luteimonas sp.]|nr:sialate O-acetylesterase [Luteimonas sp.]